MSPDSKTRRRGPHKNPRKLRPVAERFWEKVRHGEPGDCWTWIGCFRSASDPYGAFGIPGKQCRAHRIAYELTIGPIPDGFVVCHYCDNPACCNPAHLFIGRPQDNDADRVAKKRQARGEKIASAKLADEDVTAIRILRAGKHKPRYIAAAFGITAAYVWELCHPHRERWKHL